jgi:hypothetical protein
MKMPNVLTSACRYCRYFQPEGRRGGLCHQLGAPVRGDWKACALALPPFAPSWETLEEMVILSEGEQRLLNSKVSNCSLDYLEAQLAEEQDSASTKMVTANSVKV